MKTLFTLKGQQHKISGLGFKRNTSTWDPGIKVQRIEIFLSESSRDINIFVWFYTKNPEQRFAQNYENLAQIHSASWNLVQRFTPCYDGAEIHCTPRNLAQRFTLPQERWRRHLLQCCAAGPARSRNFCWSRYRNKVSALAPAPGQTQESHILIFIYQENVVWMKYSFLSP
jgi:hypothetical protein